MSLALGLACAGAAVALGTSGGNWCTAAIATLFSVGGVLVATAIGLALSMVRVERRLAPDLRLERIDMVRSAARTTVVQAGFINPGRSDISGATINVLVPDYCERIFRSDSTGRRRASGHGSMATTSESLDGFYGSIYWDETGLDFPGSVARPLYFVVVMRQGIDERRFPILVRVSSSAIEDVQETATIDRDG